jgi:hypothetical protein
MYVKAYMTYITTSNLLSALLSSASTDEVLEPLIAYTIAFGLGVYLGLALTSQRFLRIASTFRYTVKRRFRSSLRRVCR